jgi:uncharacterized membrane protein YuzA (DUF378 family)
MEIFLGLIVWGGIGLFTLKVVEYFTGEREEDEIEIGVYILFGPFSAFLFLLVGTCFVLGWGVRQLFRAGWWLVYAVGALGKRLAR